MSTATKRLNPKAPNALIARRSIASCGGEYPRGRTEGGSATKPASAPKALQAALPARFSALASPHARSMGLPPTALQHARAQ